MGTPFFHSIPPAGNRISAGALSRSVRSLQRNSFLEGPPTLGQFLGARHFFYLSSGRAALWLILSALSKREPKKREVIIPAYTCPAVVSACLKAGLKPVLSDIRLEDFGYDEADLPGKITHHTLAVVVVHLFGYPANVGSVLDLARKHGFHVIEDAAQALGNPPLDEHTERPGLQADAGFFSFGRGKPLSVLHGGVLVVPSEELRQEVTRTYQDLPGPSKSRYLAYPFHLALYSLFMAPYLYWLPQKVPFLHLGETLFDEDFPISKGLASAARVLEEAMHSLEQEAETRRKHSAWYAANLCDVEAVRRPPHLEYPYLRYPLIVRNRSVRDRILMQLTSRGTGAALFYPCPLNELPGLSRILMDPHAYPHAMQLSDTLITLPVHSGVRPEHRSEILGLIRKALADERPLEGLNRCHHRVPM